jgi:hypothetical protein
MRPFTMTMVALTAFAATAATAQAEIGGGAPVRNGDQCFKYSGGGVSAAREAVDGRFGVWFACPPGSPYWRYGAGGTGTATAPRRAARRSRAASH